MNLSEELRKFDGKHVQPLEKLVEQVSADGCLIDELLALANSDDAKMQTATTWLLKRSQAESGGWSPSQNRALLDLLHAVTAWEAVLHLLQMLDLLEIPSRKADRLRRRLLGLSKHDNKMVRAWAYNGLFVLAEQHNRFQSEVRELLQAAQQDPAASVLARVRKICRASDWTNPVH